MFITLEGPDGSGKTCQVAPLAEFLRAQGYRILTSREPGGTAIGEQVRAILNRLDNSAMHPRSETLLFLSARAQLVEEVIRPALRDGQLVLCDRYADSTLAYQGYGHGNDLQKLRMLLDFATGGLWPDLTILFDLDADEGMRRRHAGGDWNRLDAYDLDFHRRVRQGYLEMARLEPERWQLLDATQTKEAVQAALRKMILARLKQTDRN